MAVVLGVGVADAATAGAVSASTAKTDHVVPKDGTYKGSAGVDTISFKVTADGTKIVDLVTTYNPAADCSIPTADQKESFPAMKIHDGEFKGSTDLGGGIVQTFELSGSFTNDTHVKGTIHGHLTVTSLPPCNDQQPFDAARV